MDDLRLLVMTEARFREIWNGSVTDGEDGSCKLVELFAEVRAQATRVRELEQAKTKVYLVWSGRYSDKKVVAAASTPGYAQKLIETFGDGLDQPRIEPRGLDQYVDEVAAGLRPYDVVMRGEETTAKLSEYPETVGKPVYKIVYANLNLPTAYVVTVWATDDAHAIKIASDKIAAFKAADAPVS